MAPMAASGQSRRLSDVGIVCFTPNYGRITATQRTDASGQLRKSALLFDHLIGANQKQFRN